MSFLVGDGGFDASRGWLAGPRRWRCGRSAQHGYRCEHLRSPSAEVLIFQLRVNGNLRLARVIVMAESSIDWTVKTARRLRGQTWVSLCLSSTVGGRHMEAWIVQKRNRPRTYPARRASCVGLGNWSTLDRRHQVWKCRRAKIRSTVSLKWWCRVPSRPQLWLGTSSHTR